jgi:hypothetical protein
LEIRTVEGWQGDEILEGALADAIAVRQKVEDFIDGVAAVCKGEAKFESLSPLKYDEIVGEVKYKPQDWGSAVVKQIEEGPNQPLVSYRQVCTYLGTLLCSLH